MADDPTTSTITQEELDRLKELEQTKARLVAQEAKLRAEGTLTKEQMLEFSKAIAAVDLQIGSLKDKLSVSERMSRELGSAVESVKKQFGALGGPLGAIVQQIGGGLVDALSKYGHAAATIGSSQYRDFVNPLQSGSLAVLSLIPGVKSLDEAISNLRKTQTSARIAATLFGVEIKEADRAASEYPQALRRSAAATGITTEKLNEMTQAMRIVPGALRLAQGGFAGITAIQKEAIQPMAVLATVSSAFGMTSTEAANMGAEAWKNFGQSAEDTVRQMGIMADASRQTGVDRRTAREQIQSASSSLAIFGQRTGAAAGTWTTFMSSLRGAGVPISEVGKIVESVTQSIAGMSVQHRAFIGMMSGMTQGRTALGGALQLELAMRSPEGMQRNLQSLTSTLAQFAGGKVITLEEAARNPQLEMQFQLQRQMLGKLTGITSSEQQNRVLETLQNVQRGGMSQVEGSRELEKAYKEGKTIQERNLSALQRIEQVLRAGFGQEADVQLEDVDEAFRSLRGVGQDVGGGLRTAVRQIAQAPIRGRMAGTTAAESAFEALGRQARWGPRGAAEGAARRQGEPMQYVSRLINRLTGGLFERYGRAPTVRARQPRRPAGEPIPARVPMILRAPTTQRRGVVPNIRTPARRARGVDQRIAPTARGTNRALSALTTGMARRDGRKVQLMTELLGVVKRLTPAERTAVPEALLTRAPGATPPGVPTPVVTTERAGTTSTITVKITDEGRTDASKKIHDDVLTAVYKSVLGVNY